jgi:hypothetical protein
MILCNNIEKMRNSNCKKTTNCMPLGLQHSVKELIITDFILLGIRPNKIKNTKIKNI